MIIEKEVKPLIDYLVDRLVSRKFIAACVATWLVWNDKIDGNAWTIFMAWYISTLVFLKILPFFAKKQERNFKHFRFKKDDNAIDTKHIPEKD